MKKEEYLGHTNWDTWNASLWLSNVESIYRECVRIGARSLDADDAGERIKDFVASMEGFNGDGFDAEEVDWSSIGEEYLSED